MDMRENNMKSVKTFFNISKLAIFSSGFRRMLPMILIVFFLVISGPQTAKGDWLSDAGESVEEGLLDGANAINDGLNYLGDVTGLGAAVDGFGHSLETAGEILGDAGEAVADFFSGKSGPPTVPQLLPSKQREMMVGFDGVVSGQNLYMRNDGMILTEINAGVAGSFLFVLKQFEITTPHDHVTGIFQNPAPLPVSFNPIERKVNIVTVDKLVGACRNSTSGTASYTVPVTIKATLDPNMAAFPAGGQGMTSAMKQQMNQLKNRTVERADELVLTLNCRSSAIVSKIFNETCPVGFILEGTNAQGTQHQLAETEPVSAIQRSRCVRAN